MCKDRLLMVNWEL
uniref:Uncharacterized protein n=1 Tax=Anguilla anguilla TaxID=7936 RepID=A0A0E9US12_ANGAN